MGCILRDMSPCKAVFCRGSGEKLRPLGSALSPNGIGFSNGALVSLALMDKILDIDTATRRVRVQVRFNCTAHFIKHRVHRFGPISYA